MNNQNGVFEARFMCDGAPGMVTPRCTPRVRRRGGRWRGCSSVTVPTCSASTGRRSRLWSSAALSLPGVLKVKLNPKLSIYRHKLKTSQFTNKNLNAKQMFLEVTHLYPMRYRATNLSNVSITSDPSSSDIQDCPSC